MFINKPKYAEHTQTESPSYFFCCDLRCRRCPRHADDIISNYWIFEGSASDRSGQCGHPNIATFQDPATVFKLLFVDLLWWDITWKLHFPWNVILTFLESAVENITFFCQFCRYSTGALVWGRMSELWAAVGKGLCWCAATAGGHAVSLSNVSL